MSTVKQHSRIATAQRTTVGGPPEASQSTCPCRSRPWGGSSDQVQLSRLGQEAAVTRMFLQMMHSMMRRILSASTPLIAPYSQGMSKASTPNFGGSQPHQLQTGQVRDLKAGESVRGCNGTLLKRHKNGQVDISFRDKGGRERRLRIVGNEIWIEGKKSPRKLTNRGQILTLPNGDAIALGNAVGPNGKKTLARVSLSDDGRNFRTFPPGKTDEISLSTTALPSNGASQAGGIALGAFAFSDGGAMLGVFLGTSNNAFSRATPEPPRFDLAMQFGGTR